jgi:integrase
VRGYNSIRDNRFKKASDKPIKDIKNWQELINDETKLFSPKSVANAWGLVSSVLRFHNINVPDNITLPQRVKYDAPYLEPDQIQPFLEIIKGERCEAVALLALHSLRRSEIYAQGLDANIDLKNNRIKVSGAAVYDENNMLVTKKTNKNESSARYMPILIDRLSAVVKEKRRKGEPLIQGHHPDTMFYEINRLCKSNGLPEVGYHGLRHSFASLAHHLNVPIMIAMQMGGWKDYNTMLKIYTHLSQKDVDRYGDEMREFFNHSKNTNYNTDVKCYKDVNCNLDIADNNATVCKIPSNFNAFGA